MEDIDVKQLEELQAVLSAKSDSGNGGYKRDRSGTNNIMAVIAVISALVALGGFIFAFISNRVEPLSQTIGYMQTQETEMRQRLDKQVSIDTESLKNRAALEERFKETETQFANFEDQVHELKAFKEWWTTEMLPKLVSMEARQIMYEERFETMVKDVHLMMRSGRRLGGGMGQ